jgi:predicted porin
MQFSWVDSNTPNFTNRNSFAGLHGEDWGKVFVGRFDSIVKDAEFSVDQFNWTDADIGVLFRNQNRYNNTINYHSPKIGPGIQVKAQVIPGESRQNFDGDDRQTNIAEGYGLSVGMEEGNMYGAIAYESNVETFGSVFTQRQFNQIFGGNPFTNPLPSSQDLDVQTFRVSGGLDDDQFGVGFIYDSTETSGPNNGYDDAKTGWLVSGRFNPTTDLAVKAQYGDSETRFHAFGDNDDRSITSATLGADYMLGKQTKLYTFYTMNEVDGETAGNMEDDSEFNVLAFGMQHKF